MYMSIKTLDYVIFSHQANLSKTTKHWDGFVSHCIFILTTIHCTSEDLAILFVLHVFSKHRVPEHVTSDCGLEFISHFFHSLGKALDMNLHFTSGYHPKGDH